METSFYLVLHIKTTTGYETYGKFLLGKDKETAYQIFNQLLGKADVDESDVIYIDMIEEKAGLPLNLKMMSCTLQQLAENSKIITKELFKAFNLKEK